MKAKSSKLIALAAVMSALCVVILLLGSVITVLDISCAAFSSLIIIISLIELPPVYPWLIYAVTSILSLLILPDKFGALIFFVFIGYYPIIKKHIERLPKFLRWIIKLILCNIALSIIIAASKFILGIDSSELDFTYLAYILTNIAFILYDIALSRLIFFYYIKIRPKIKIFKY